MTGKIAARARALALAILTMALCVSYAYPRDPDGRFAGSSLKQWFDSLHSGNGPCCSVADGTAVADPDWQMWTAGGRSHYLVRLDGKWIEVPDEALVTEPNRAGHAMVWPMYQDGTPRVRCFMPGPMT